MCRLSDKLTVGTELARWQFRGERRAKQPSSSVLRPHRTIGLIGLVYVHSKGASDALCLQDRRTGHLAGFEPAGKTVLLVAAERGDLAMATAAMAAGADVNLASINRVTPLMAASYAGQVDLVKALLAAGAQVDLQDHLHKPAMVYAAGQGQAEVVGLLLDRGVPVDAAYEHQLTALMWAAGQGSVVTTQLLLARGARTELRDDRGLTAADIARQAGLAPVLAVLDGR